MLRRQKHTLSQSAPPIDGRSARNVPRVSREPSHFACETRGFSETGRIRFRGARFQTPNSVSFSGLTEFRGANSVGSSQPIIVCQNELTEFFAELTEFGPELSEAQ